jgi:RNA polymerase sigma-70 factor, ECF subfamily
MPIMPAKPRPRARPGARSVEQKHVAALLHRVGQGDEVAFAELHAVTVRKLRATVAEMLGNDADVDDVLQEGYLKIWTAAHQFRARLSSPMTWMIAIVRNTAIDRVRRRRRMMVPIDEEALSLAESPVDPFEEDDRKVETQIVLTAMRTLAPQRAELISRAYLQGQSREVLAKAYGAPAATVKTWLRRSLAELRRQLEADTSMVARKLASPLPRVQQANA